MARASQFRQAVCKKCEDGFLYRFLGRVRRVCDDCIERHNRTVHKEHKKKARAPLKSTAMFSAALISRDECARLLGIAPNTVQLDEARAVAKLKSCPELIQLWASIRENGFPEAIEPGPQAGDLILHWQVGMDEWWATYDRLMQAANAECGVRSAEIKAAAAEVLGLITQFQRKLETVTNRVGHLESRKKK